MKFYDILMMTDPTEPAIIFILLELYQRLERNSPNPMRNCITLYYNLWNDLTYLNP